MKMNKICKEYISEIKALFPIRRKQEKEYINKLVSDIEGFCEEANVTTKENLYTEYGQPNDIVNNYLATINTAHIVKQIKTTRYVKILIIAMLVMATITTSLWCVFTYRDHQITARQEIFFEDEVLLETN